MTLDTNATALPAPRRPDGPLRRFLREPLAVVSASIIALIVLLCLLAPLLSPFDPDRSDLALALLPPGGEHLLGTDASGRDVLARLLHGGRYTLAGAAVALAAAAVVGVVAGVIAGYLGRAIDATASWVASLLMALPGIIVLLAARAAIGQSLWGVMVILGVLLSPSFFRLTRTLVVAVRNELFVDAAKVAGVGDARIIGVHVLGVVRGPLIIQAAMVFGIAIAVQAGLEFLALGDRSLPSWGSMLNEGFTRIYSDPELLLPPALAITLTCAALALLGNGLRDSLEPSPVPVRRQRHGVAPVANAAATDPEVLLSVQQLRVAYATADGAGKDVVHDVSFDVRHGEVVGLIGESGSGKTQTAFSIMGVLPTGGHVAGGAIVWRGDALNRTSQRALRGRSFAYIPQEPLSNLDPSFTIGAQLTEPLRSVKKLSKRAAHERAVALLARVGIVEPERVMRSYPHEISGGMAQRVLIAGAVSCDPELLIADEPTTALDVTVQAEVLDLLRDLQREREMGIVLVTHNFGVVADLCDRVVVMRDGRVVESGETAEVFANPQSAYTRALLDAIIDESQEREPYEEATR